MDARGTRNDDREGCGTRGMRPATSSRSAHAGTERASVLKRLKGALAALAGGAALDPLCARRSDAIAGDGRRRNANRALGCEVLNARSPAIGTVVLARLAVCAAVFTAVSLPSQSALAAYPWSASPESEIFDSVAATVETRGVIRPGTASKAITNARPSAETVGTCAVAPYRWHISLRRAGFEAQHPWSSWPTAFGSEVPRQSYAALEYRTKQWLSEALIEGWFPHIAEEQLCFDANGIVRSSPVYCNTTRRDQVLVGNAHDQRVSERIATRDHSPSCYPDAGCQDHSVRRTGKMCLDIHTHRRLLQFSHRVAAK